MAAIGLTTENFTDTVGDGGIVLVDFWASWCGPCRIFAPVFEDAAERHPDIVFGKVDTEAQIELAQAFGISSIPTLMAIRDGVVLYAQPGALPAKASARVRIPIRNSGRSKVFVSPPPLKS